MKLRKEGMDGGGHYSVTGKILTLYSVFSKEFAYSVKTRDLAGNRLIR